MELVASAGRLLRVVSFLAVLGLVTVVLGSLVIGVLSLVVGLLAAVLPFAVVGLLVWVACAAVASDLRGTWRRFRTGASALLRWAVVTAVAAFLRVSAGGVRVGRALVPPMLALTQRVISLAQAALHAGFSVLGWGARATRAGLSRTWGSAGFVSGVIVEALGGAVVAAILVCLADPGDSGPDLGPRLFAGAVAGGFLGLLVGAARFSRTTQSG